MAKVTKKATAKRRVKKNVEHGQAHIQSSFNNTIVTLTVSDICLDSSFFLPPLCKYYVWTVGIDCKKT